MSAPSRLIGFLVLLGFSSGLLADPIRQADISAKSPWAVHVNAAKLQNSPLGAFLLKTVGFDRVLQLQGSLQAKLALDLNAINGLTLFGSGENWQETAMLLRGNFDPVDLGSLPLASQEGVSGNGIPIHEGPGWRQGPLYLAKRSETELVGGTSLQAVEGCLQVLGDSKKSWHGIVLSDHAIEELNAATAVLALDMKELGAELQFEADFTRSVRRAWLLIGSHDEDVEVTVLVDSTDAESLSFLRNQLTLLTAMLTSGEDVPPAWRALVAALKVETQGHWMTVKIAAPPEKASEFLQSLETLFRETSGPGEGKPAE